VSESVIICAIICATIVMVSWIASLSMERDVEPKSEDTSDKIKYMMCGEALQNGICKQLCYRCAWRVENKDLMEEKNNG